MLRSFKEIILIRTKVYLGRYLNYILLYIDFIVLDIQIANFIQTQILLGLHILPSKASGRIPPWNSTMESQSHDNYHNSQHKTQKFILPSMSKWQTWRLQSIIFTFQWHILEVCTRTDS